MSRKEAHLVSTTPHYKHQQLFDMAVRGLASQGFTRSLDSTGVCAYRGEGGKRCAIGWCIPDEKYSSSLEHGKLAYDREVIAAADAFLCSPMFLRSLQRCHDYEPRPADMKDRLKRLAFDWELTIPSDGGLL